MNKQQCLLILFMTASCYACPNGWITYNQNCYLVLTIQTTWGAASSYCQAFRAKLAEPRSVQEAHFLSVMTYPVGGIYWIGVTDIAVEGDWIFASDSSYVNSSYWHSTEPSGKPLENCVVMRDTFMGYWDDVLCSTEAGFVCEKIDTCECLVTHVGPSLIVSHNSLFHDSN